MAAENYHLYLLDVTEAAMIRKTKVDAKTVDIYMIEFQVKYRLQKFKTYNLRSTLLAYHYFLI